MKRAGASRGFTLVELLIVIVVIAILAAITIVAYGGVTSKAQQSAVQSDLANAKNALAAYHVTNGAYPSTLDAAGIKASGNNSYTYSYNATTDGYSLTSTNNSYSAFVTDKQQALVRGTAQGLVGWWPMNDATDWSGNGLDPSIASTTTGSGANGGSSAQVFNGSSTLFTVNDSSALDPTVGVTVTAWINAVSWSTSLQAGIVSKDIQSGINNPPYGMYANTSGTSWIGIITTAANASPSVTCNDTLATGTWYFLAMTADGATITDYQNGDSCASTASSALPVATTGALRIGQQKTGMGRYFTGSIDDVRVYSRALTADEIKTIYNAGAV